MDESELNRILDGGEIFIDVSDRQDEFIHDLRKKEEEENRKKIVNQIKELTSKEQIRQAIWGKMEEQNSKQSQTNKSISGAIPTIGPNGIQFRSRIEATWAFFFDKLGWEWEYEAFDLKGYIPDFVLLFGDEKVLVEIKSELDYDKLDLYADKIIKSGWRGRFMICGSRVSKITHPLDDCDTVIKIGRIHYNCLTNIRQIDDEEWEEVEYQIVATDAFIAKSDNHGWTINFEDKDPTLPHKWIKDISDHSTFKPNGYRERGKDHEIVLKYWYESKNNSQWNKPKT